MYSVIPLYQHYSFTGFIFCHHTLDYFYIVIFIYLIWLLSWFIKSPWVISLVFHGDMLQYLGNVFTDKFVTSFEWVHGFALMTLLFVNTHHQLSFSDNFSSSMEDELMVGVWTLFYQMLNLLLPTYAYTCIQGHISYWYSINSTFLLLLQLNVFESIHWFWYRLNY